MTKRELLGKKGDVAIWRDDRGQIFISQGSERVWFENETEFDRFCELIADVIDTLTMDLMRSIK